MSSTFFCLKDRWSQKTGTTFMALGLDFRLLGRLFTSYRLYPGLSVHLGVPVSYPIFSGWRGPVHLSRSTYVVTMTSVRLQVLDDTTTTLMGTVILGPNCTAFRKRTNPGGSFSEHFLNSGDLQVFSDGSVSYVPWSIHHCSCGFVLNNLDFLAPVAPSCGSIQRGRCHHGLNNNLVLFRSHLLWHPTSSQSKLTIAFLMFATWILCVFFPKQTPDTTSCALMVSWCS